MKRLGRFLIGGIIAVGVVVPVVASTASVAGATSTNLTLESPWKPAPFGTATPSVSLNAGIVSFRGAIKAKPSNTKDKPFVLPAAYRPAFKTWLPVDMCNSTNGRLIIKPNGVTLLQEQDGALANADCFTSLDGVSFVRSSAVTPLTLINGWTESDFSTANAAITVVKGVVHFQGAVEANLGSGPTSAEPFVLPPSFRPSRPVDVAVDMCEAANGRLEIGTNGAVSVQEEDQGTTDENCFTSLDGASFVLQPKNSSALTLLNGWTGQAFGTDSAAAQLSKGIVRFQGGIQGGSASQITTLPSSMRPTTNVFIKVDLCNAAADGRLDIASSGSVSVEQEPGGLGSAAVCFTSLDGASFVK